MTPGTVSAVEKLLVRTDQLLSGELPTGSANPNRTACWVARRALELVVLDLLTRRSVRTRTATMRSLLICLSVTYQDQPGPGVTAQSAGDQLSRACHQHAYELAPTHAEAVQMLGTVRRVVAIGDVRGSLDSSRWSSR